MLVFCSFALKQKNQKVKAKRCFSPLCSKAGNTTNAGKPHLCVSICFAAFTPTHGPPFCRPTHLYLYDFIVLLLIGNNLTMKASVGGCPRTWRGIQHAQTRSRWTVCECMLYSRSWRPFLFLFWACKKEERTNEKNNIYILIPTHFPEEP